MLLSKKTDQFLSRSEGIEEPCNSNRSHSSSHDQLEKQDYSELPNLSDSILSGNDKVKFPDLFEKYRAVVALSNAELGRTSLVQHMIDTGDATPIQPLLKKL